MLAGIHSWQWNWKNRDGCGGRQHLLCPVVCFVQGSALHVLRSPVLRSTSNLKLVSGTVAYTNVFNIGNLFIQGMS